MNDIGIGIDPNTNDVYIDSTNNLVMVSGAKAVAQHVRQRLMTFEGEWFLDLDAGTPWFDQVLGGKYDPALAEALVKAEIMGTPEVTDITSFSVSFTRQVRRLNIRDVTVMTTYDEEVRV